MSTESRLLLILYPQQPSLFNAVWNKNLLWKAENGNEEDNVLYYDVNEDDYGKALLTQFVVLQ